MKKKKKSLKHAFTFANRLFLYNLDVFILFGSFIQPCLLECNILQSEVVNTLMVLKRQWKGTKKVIGFDSLLEYAWLKSSWYYKQRKKQRMLVHHITVQKQKMLIII